MAVSVIGVREVQELLRQVDRVAQKVITKSAKSGANIALKDARANAPKSTGNLKKSIKLKAEKRRKGKKVYDIKFIGENLVKISTTGKRSFYPASQEFGWVDEQGRRHEGKRFLRNAIDNNRGQIEQEVLRTMYTGLGGVR